MTEEVPPEKDRFWEKFKILYPKANELPKEFAKELKDAWEHISNHIAEEMGMFLNFIDKITDNKVKELREEIRELIEMKDKVKKVVEHVEADIREK